MGTFSQFTNAMDWAGLGELVLRIVAILLCLVVHEVCHGLAAYRLGDPTAKMSRRLSLNPIHHLDVFGLIMMVTVGFGWAKPVPIDPRYFKNPKRGMAITALAGPASNFVLAYLSCILLSGYSAVLAVRGESAASGSVTLFLSMLILLNIGLGIFNLIPFPPLDGSKVLFSLLPDRMYQTMLRYERIGIGVLLALSVIGIGSSWLTNAIVWVFELFCRIVGV